MLEKLPNLPHALKFVPDCYVNSKTCDKAVILIILRYNLFLIEICSSKKC